MLADYLLKTAATRLAKVLQAAAHAGDEAKITRMAKKLMPEVDDLDHNPYIFAFNRIAGIQSPLKSQATPRLQAMGSVVDLGHRNALKEEAMNARPTATSMSYTDRMNKINTLNKGKSWVQQYTGPVDFLKRRHGIPANMSVGEFKLQQAERIKQRSSAQKPTPIAGDTSPRVHQPDPGVSFSQGYNRDPEEWVDIRHAGGKGHIERFLKGESPGYRLEGDTNHTGIQIHPMNTLDSRTYDNVMSRDAFYAGRGLGKYYDQPAVLTGQVQAKHLIKAPNAYEAGFPGINHKFIRNPKVEQIPFDHQINAPGGAEAILKTVKKRHNLSSLSIPRGRWD